MPAIKRISLIVAGGTGTRMGSEIPKQFLLLKGRPVLMYTIEKFFSQSDEVIVVLPENWMEHWQKLCNEYNFYVEHKTVAGGNTRAESVRNGLTGIYLNAIVAVHDGARPLVSNTLINQLFIAAGEYGSAVPVVQLSDSLRILEGSTNRSVDRSAYRLVQTPQCYKVDTLLRAFNNKDYHLFSDEASLMEASGNTVYLVEGEVTNIKITVPEDFIIAEHFLV